LRSYVYWPQTGEGIVFTLPGNVSGEKFRACEPIAAVVQSLMKRAPIEGRA
jgi:hypothetical protein